MADEADFPLCVGDGLPLLEEILQNADGSNPDLTGATVQLVIQDEDHAAPAFGGQADIVGDPTQGVVRYTWLESDTQTPGVYSYRWVVTFPSATLPETFPNGKRPRRLVISQRT